MSEADAEAPETAPEKQLLRFCKISFSDQDIEIAESSESHIAVSTDGEGRPLEGNRVDPAALEQLQKVEQLSGQEQAVYNVLMEVCS